MIQQELHALQEQYGYLTVEGLRALSVRMNVPLRRLHEVASCFPHYRLEPPPAVEFKVCRDMACHLSGAAEYIRALTATASELGGGDRVCISGVSCLGQCDAAPAVMVGHHVHRGKSIDECRHMLRDAAAGDGAKTRHATHLESKHRTAKATGWRIDPYGGLETYAAARKFVEGENGDKLIAELKASDLRGMGGAGVPAHQKWNDVRQARGDRKFVIVNGDESEPGTFKDRELLLRTPHLVIEGVVLGGLLTGAERGYIYIRHEYEPQIKAVEAAIERAEAMGVCGENALGTGRNFPIEVYVSPGGYICGEQSALIEAMEDKRAEPRNKPPMIETNGYLDKPTLLSNVETFAWVPSIWMNGGDWYAGLGINGYKGARFFSISGDLKRPGVFEVPNGLPLRDLIEVHAGGMKDGLRLKAVATSGPSAGFLPPQLPASMLPKAAREKLNGAPTMDLLDARLDLQAFRDLGLMLGAGLVVYGHKADMLDQAINCTEFFRNESCGKCVPCRVGCQKLVEIGHDVRDGRYETDGLGTVETMIGDLRQAMEMASICGLGMVGANPLGSVAQHFPRDLETYLTATRADVRTDRSLPR
jgi:NADH:ubiquinone oxidoreductase subunit F (NADH-binding)/NADH:ubiquinone oxidoreductase subunit E